MFERRQRSTRSLSRETVQQMLEMKSLLRKYGTTISLTDPNVHDLLIQASEAIDDEEVAALRRRLIDARDAESEQPTTRKTEKKETPFTSDGGESKRDKSVFTTPPIVENGSSAPIQDFPPLPVSTPEATAARDVYIQGPFVEDEINVFLESGEIQRPTTTKRVILNTPRTGLLRCDACQRTTTVKATASPDEAVEVMCVCGASYRVLLDSRKYDRKKTSLPGFYVDQQDEMKTGTIVVENISFGGLRFRTTSPQNIAFGDLLNIQFTLDDQMKTLVWEKARVHYVNMDIVGVEFMEPDEFNKDLAAYLMT